MNKGDWVMYICDGRIGRLTIVDYMPMYSLVDYGDNTFSRVVHHQYLKPVHPAVADILTAVNNQSLPVTNTKERQ